MKNLKVFVRYLPWRVRTIWISFENTMRYCQYPNIAFWQYKKKKLRNFSINPQTLVAQKIADEVVFRRFQGEQVEFFKIGPHWPPSDFWCASFGNYQFRLFQLSFSVWFYIKICFESNDFIAYPKEWDWRELKRCLFTVWISH